MLYITSTFDPNVFFRVITGAKLEIIDNTIVISIQQGRLLPNGVIENKTEWLSPNVTTRERISLDELSPIDLTRVKIPHTDVMTGLKLTKVRVGTDSAKPQYRIRLTALAHPYNFKEGFVGGLAIEYTADVGRSRVHQDDVISLFGRSPDSVIRDEYVDFIVSDGDDGGRRTLPLIDSREVVSDVLTPLSGAGLYLSRQHTGALVRLELLTYNLKPHFFYNTD
ncbi:hypothetical protein QAD02_011931 [Eretmocerus hayati]|uniref:Uncharacterized protein n=1 Tax=Eretmocerus hayati TaxID=131215 RepID=A0ACC2NY67_9HYME|nr:hypothetical protein QAD02_011931 [Eretmocerus hayati]